MKNLALKAGAVILLASLEGVISFARPIATTTRRYHSKLFAVDDGIDEGKNKNDGEDLAKQFYDQVRKREMESSSDEILGSVDKSSASPTSASNSNQQTPQDSASSASSAPSQKKFTGKPLVEPTPAPFRNSGSLFDEQEAQGSPREQMMEREFNLVGRAEAAIPFQAALAFCVLCFYIYIGFTGGIKSETDFTIDSEDGFLEQIMPEQRDTEASYWL